jgi:hypothetical protein
MKPPIRTNQDSSPYNVVKIVLAVVFLGILLILVAFLFRGNRLPLAVTNTETPVIPTLFVPTPDCGSPTLLLGSNTFHIETITSAADGSIPVPADKAGIAYWVEDTNTNYVFVLSPMPENLAAMSTLTVGSIAKVTWSNCNSTTYTLSAPQQGSFSASDLPDQSTEGITVFFQTDPSGASFVFNGELTEEQISTFNTPASSASEIQAEISLLETTASADGTSIRIGVSIQNYGAAPITLSVKDVSFIQQDSTALAMASSEPPLPKEIAPGVTETIYFTFPRPSSQTATLKIFAVEYDIEGY